MINMKDIMSGDFSAYPEEIQEYMENFSEKLREKIKQELVEGTAERMLSALKASKEDFIDILAGLLENGCKGLNDMSTNALLNMYLAQKTEDEFIRLIDTVTEELGRDI